MGEQLVQITNDEVVDSIRKKELRPGVGNFFYQPSQFQFSYQHRMNGLTERGASKHSLATLDAIQKRAIKLIGDPALTNSLDSLAHRTTISALSLYYRYYHGVCSVELKSIIPPKAHFTRNTVFERSAPLRCQIG